MYMREPQPTKFLSIVERKTMKNRPKDEPQLEIITSTNRVIFIVTIIYETINNTHYPSLLLNKCKKKR